MAAGETNGQGFWAGVAHIRDVAFIIAVYLFFTGFVYRYYYLTSFGISPKLDDSALYSVLIFAYTVFTDAVVRNPLAVWWVALPILSVILVILIADARRRHADRNYRLFRRRVALELGRWSLPAIVAVSILLVPLLFNAARDAAQTEAYAFRASAAQGIDFKVIATLNDAAAKSYDPTIRSSLAGSTMRIVSESDAAYYFLKQLPYNAKLTPARAAIFVVRKDDIKSVEISLPGRDTIDAY